MQFYCKDGDSLRGIVDCENVTKKMQRTSHKRARQNNKRDTAKRIKEALSDLDRDFSLDSYSSEESLSKQVKI